MGNIFPYSDNMASRILNCSSPRPGYIPPILSYERFKRETEYKPLVKGEINGIKGISEDSIQRS